MELELQVVVSHLIQVRGVESMVPLEEQYVLLTIEPSLQPHQDILKM